MDSDFITYLESDGIQLPLNQDGLPTPHYEYKHDLDAYDSSSEAQDLENANEDENQNQISFPLIQSQIQDAIHQLDGIVFPKLNWSSPKDASWITLDSTLKCRDASDIFLLLKSSDFIQHDLSMAQLHSIPLVLCLREWFDLNPSMEFRCFIKNQKIIGISQRDIGQFYDFLESMTSDVSYRIQEFYNTIVNPKWQMDCVMDVYLTKSKRVLLMDLNPFQEFTDSLLFQWNELQECKDDFYEFRCIKSQQEAFVYSHEPKYTCNRLPKDVIDLSNGVSIQEFVNQFESELNLQIYSDEF